MAERLGLDPTQAMFTPPTTPEAKVLDAYRIGQHLLMGYAVVEPWVSLGAEPKLARQAATLIDEAAITDRGRSAISYMTEGYGHELADAGRRAMDDADDPALLQARRSDGLADLAAKHWPVADPGGALEFVANAQASRSVDLDNPDAMVDLRLSFGQARVTCGAVALALGPDMERFSNELFSAAAALRYEFDAGVKADWAFHAASWGNLLLDEPLPYALVVPGG
jgi:hypothetical protein